MSKEVKRRRYCVSEIALQLTVGGIFTALGIAISVNAIKGLIKYGTISDLGPAIILPIIIILALMGFGMTALIMGGKQIYLWIRENRTREKGIESLARIIDYKRASFGKRTNTNIRYALVLSYNDGGVDKTFTTDYLFDINEFRYLKELEEVKIKIDGNFVIVSEKFTEEIYKLDSVYGIERAFFKQKFVKILLRVFGILLFASIIFLIASMLLENGTLVKAAMITFGVVNFGCIVPLAVSLIRWMMRKK